MSRTHKLYTSCWCTILLLLLGFSTFCQSVFGFSVGAVQVKTSCEALSERGACCPEEEPAETYFCCIPIIPIQDLDHHKVEYCSKSAQVSTRSSSTKNYSWENTISLPLFIHASKASISTKRRQAWLCCFRI